MEGPGQPGLSFLGNPVARRVPARTQGAAYTARRVTGVESMNLTHVRVASAIRELSERYTRAGWTRDHDAHWDQPIAGTLIYFCDVDSNELIALELVQGAIERLAASEVARLPVNQV